VYDLKLILLCSQQSYFSYCISRFGRLIDRPSILDAENEEYAADCCRDLWAARYPLDPFDLDNNEFDGSNLNAIDNDNANTEIVKIVQTYAVLAARFASPFVSEGVYHVAAKRRYMRFLDLIREGVCTTRQDTRLVPSLDILLMWLAHQVCLVTTSQSHKAIKQSSKQMMYIRLHLYNCYVSLTEFSSELCNRHDSNGYQGQCYENGGQLWRGGE
jgi:hypothetical protein